jgi:hypothetical protein
VLLERTSGSTAMGRARELMKGNLGKGFVLNLVVTLLVVVITMTVTYVVDKVVGTLGLPLAVTELAYDLVTAVFMPVQLAAIVLLYYDLRIRKEAFDLEVLAGSLPGQLSTE